MGADATQRSPAPRFPGDGLPSTRGVRRPAGPPRRGGGAGAGASPSGVGGRVPRPARRAGTGDGRDRGGGGPPVGRVVVRDRAARRPEAPRALARARPRGGTVAGRVPRPRRRGDLGARLLGPRRAPRRVAGGRVRPRAGVVAGRTPAGSVARLPGGRRPRRHPAPVARRRSAQPGQPHRPRRAGRAPAPGARHRPLRPGGMGRTPPRAHRRTGRDPGRLRAERCCRDERCARGGRWQRAARQSVRRRTRPSSPSTTAPPP